MFSLSQQACYVRAYTCIRQQRSATVIGNILPFAQKSAYKDNEFRIAKIGKNVRNTRQDRAMLL